MKSRPAVAMALLAAAFAAAGCGLGPGEDVGDASLRVTRDYGARTVLEARLGEVAESDTVMRVLDREADISTRYGGGFVAAIEGVREAVRDGRRFDWFFYVDGVESPVGAADYTLRGGEAIWWDYRDWSAASRVPAVVGSWPRPLAGGYEGRRRPVAVECRGGGAACAAVRGRLEEAGVEPLAGSAAGDGAPAGAIRVLVGPWARLRGDAAARQLESGPQATGVFADFERRGGGYALLALDEGGDEAAALGPGAGLVAATRRFDGPPVWIVAGATARGVGAAARLLDAATLRGRYAVAGDRGGAIPLPVPAEPSS